MTATATEKQELPRLVRGMAVIERVGNALPHPFWLFWILSAILAVVSAILAALDVSVVSPKDGKIVAVQNLLSGDGLQMAVSTAISNFAEFPPMATIVVVIMGVALAERTGFLQAVMRVSVSRVPTSMVVFAVAFAGTMAHVASAAAYIILVPLGGLAFRAVGRSPILGIVVAYTAIASGYDASPIPTPNDAIFAGITTAAAKTVNPDAYISPLSNWFFNIASSVLLALVITLVTRLVLNKRTDLEPDADAELDDLEALQLKDNERRGLRRAGIVFGVAVVAIVAVMVPHDSPLRGENGSIVESPFLDGIAMVVAVLFGLVGITYGVTVGAIKKGGDVPKLMAEGIKQMAPVLVLFFAIAQFLAYFSWSKIGDLLSAESARLLGDLGAPTVVIFLGILVLLTLINIPGHQRFGDVGTDRADPGADDAAAERAGRDHPGAVPDRRLGLHRDHADESVLRDGARVPAAVPQGRGGRHARVVHGAARDRDDDRLDAVVPGVVGARDPARTRCAGQVVTVR